MPPLIDKALQLERAYANTQWRTRRVMRLTIPMCAGMVLFIFFGGYSEDPAPLYVSLLVGAGTLAWGAAQIIAVLRERRAYNALDEVEKEIKARVPFQLRLEAAVLYGDKGGLIAALECHEAHFPGDCPLCGAT